MNDLTNIGPAMKEAAAGFEKMQKALLVFAGVAALGLLVCAIAIFNK